MSLNDLVSSQPEEVGPTPTDTESVMVDEYEEQASETSVNSDGSDDQTEISPEEQEENNYKNKTQQRINDLVRSRKEMEEKLIRAEADREAYEKYSQSNKEKTFEDHDINTLTRFVADNQDDPDLAAEVVKVREIIMRKTIKEEVNSLVEKQNATTNQEKGEQLTNQMIAGISGDRLRDTSSDYYSTAYQTLQDLSTPQYQNVNKDQLIASLVAEREFLMKQSKGPTLNDRVEQNKRNNNLKINTRQSSSGSGDLSNFLNENSRLERSTINSSGSLREAIKKMGVLKGL